MSKARQQRTGRLREAGRWPAEKTGAEAPPVSGRGRRGADVPLVGGPRAPGAGRAALKPAPIALSVSPVPRSWRALYAAALHDSIADRSEGAEIHLQRAYELGRQALAERCSLLDLVALHNQSVVAYLERRRAAGPRVAARSGRFLAEAIAAYDMTHRGIDEANAALRNVHTYVEQAARRTAYALHDGAGQLLAAVYLQLNEIGRALPPRPRRQLLQLRGLLTQIEEQLRAIAHEIRPPLLDDLGLVPALHGLGDSFGRRTGIQVVVEASEAQRFPPAVETALYRIAQEALNNVQKHAQARRVRIALRDRPGSAALRVEDDGVGFDTVAVLEQRQKPGLGLASIRERAESLGGHIAFLAAPGRGTVLQVRIPLEVDHADTGTAR